MPANVVHLVVDALKPRAVERLAASLGEPPGAARKALTAALPAALLGLIARSRTPQGADLIRDAIHDNHLDGAVLDTLADRAQIGAPAGGLMLGGSAAAERLIDGPTAPLAERLASYADVRRSSAQALIALAVPLLLAAVARAYPRPMDTGSFQRALAEQDPFARHATPPGFGPPMAARPVPRHAAATPPAERDGVAWRAILGVLVLGSAAVFFWALTRDRAREVAPAARVERAAPAPDLSTSTQSARVILPEDTPPALAPGSMADALQRYLTSADPAPQRFLFQDLVFAKSSARLAPESALVLDAVATVLNANPGAEVRIEGHTDARGGRSANERLSERRAKAVAMALVERGIEPERVSSMGLGESRPIAPNDSEDGRIANRRTDLVVLSKG